MDIRQQLLDALQGTVLLMGIGNLCRGDDAAGSHVAQQIRSAPGVYVIDAQEVPENYLWRVVELGPDTIVFMDCVDLGCPPGSVAFFDADQTLPYWPSTHRAPLGLTLDFLRRTTRARMFVIAIQPLQMEFLEPMSADVCSSVESIVDVLNSVLGMRISSPRTEATCPAASEVTV